MLNLDENDKLSTYTNLIFEGNQKSNLTGYKNHEDIYKQGILDSILIRKTLENNGYDFLDKTILDIGAGAGFPSMPWKIYNDNFNLEIVESLGKRVNFLNNITTELNLSVNVFNERVERLKNRNCYYDLITARAVTSVKNLFMLAHHLLKPNGFFIMPKGRNYKQELKEISHIFPEIKKDIKVFSYINSQNDESYIIVIQKTTKTPVKWPFEWKKIMSFGVNKLSQ